LHLRHPDDAWVTVRIGCSGWNALRIGCAIPGDDLLAAATASYQATPE